MSQPANDHGRTPKKDYERIPHWTNGDILLVQLVDVLENFE